jgi:C_GCAxxG_C_C family probable redox protein
MSGHTQQAVELFEKGYNCSQAIFAAFCDETGVDSETALKISASFGGGMGRLREVCGAVSGMFLVVGAKYGYAKPDDRVAKDEHYRLIQELAKKFKEHEGTIICSELLGREAGWDNPNSDERTRDYYNLRPCAKFVVEAAIILDEYIASRKLENKI